MKAELGVKTLGLHKKKFEIEKHYDDCGEDLSSILLYEPSLIFACVDQPTTTLPTEPVLPLLACEEDALQRHFDVTTCFYGRQQDRLPRNVFLYADLKAYMDTWGHAADDRYLLQTCEIYLTENKPASIGIHLSDRMTPQIRTFHMHCSCDMSCNDDWKDFYKLSLLQQPFCRVVVGWKPPFGAGDHAVQLLSTVTDETEPYTFLGIVL